MKFSRVFRFRSRLPQAGGCALLAACAPLAMAEPTGEGASSAGELDTVQVVGLRASLATAQSIKRDKVEVVDSVAADDIAKLPDFSTTDALSRVTGIQIMRERGEGGNAGGVPGVSGVAIRGLTQMETLLNGREVFTAGWGRTYDLADIPSDMLAGIDVYKTSSARHIEGGVGGMVDLRTRKPFDFAGREIAVTARAVHGDLVNKDYPQFSTLLSDRWQTGGGEFGALFNLALQQRGWREDQVSAGAPTARTNIIPGQTVTAPNGITENVSLGRRERTGAAMVFEWMPAENLELHAEGNYSEFRTIQDTYQLTASAPATFVPGSVVLFPGTNDLQSITWTNAPFTSVGTARDTLDRTAQLAVGSEWTKDALTLKTDLSYTKSHNSLLYTGVPLGGATGALSQNLSGGLPVSNARTINLNNLASFTTAGIWYASRPFDGELTAAALDGEYRLDASYFDKLSGGLRFARRYATDAPGQVGFYPATVPAANAAPIVVASPYGNYATVNPAAARNVTALCGTLGVACAIPADNPQGTWTIGEDTQSAYVMGEFGEGKRLAGNVGVRIVHTGAMVSGYQTVPATNGFAPLQTKDKQTDALPSLNLRYGMGEGRYLRGAASQTVPRQDFNQLSPSLTLNPVLLIGSAGNPALKPVRADNVDLAVEKYFDESTSIYTTLFWKQVDGFVTTVSNPETHGGVTYQVSRPQNAKLATINGLELGYQQFYEDLPGWLRGLGLQANYTYADSSMNDSILGQSAPLQNLSRNSFNVVGMYEREVVSARIAYNWRDKYLSGIANFVGIGALPVYTRAYGWLDASVTYRYSDDLSVTLAGLNLLRTVRSSYYGVETRPQSSWVNDRQFSASVTMKF